MNAIDFHCAKPGDVCNLAGDIRGLDKGSGAKIISAGKIQVTASQAERANRYGWSGIGEQNGLVTIWR